MAGKRPRKISDADLARVGPGTPGGEWLRRHWLAISRAEDVKDIPVGLRILGEDLVLFRDDRGRLGALSVSRLAVRFRRALLGTARRAEGMQISRQGAPALVSCFTGIRKQLSDGSCQDAAEESAARGAAIQE